MSVIAERFSNSIYHSLGSFESAARESRVNLLKAAEIVLLRKTEMLRQRQAVLANGQKMQVVLPETVSSSTYVNRDFEPEVSTALDLLIKPGMCLWNVGAHIGLRLKQAHETLGRDGLIYAFEPTTRTRNFLEKYNARGLFCPVAVQPYALSNFDGYTQLTDFGWRFSGSNTIEEKPRMREKTRRSLTPVSYDVPVRTVDGLIWNGFVPPDVLCVDAEGSDGKVLLGALKTLRNFHPAIIFEGGDKGATNTRSCIDLLQGLGYGLKEADQGERKLIPHVVQSSYQDNCNLVAVWN